MNYRKNYKLLVPLIVGFIYYFSVFANGRTASIFQITGYFQFSDIQWVMPYVGDAVQRYLPVMIAHVIFGTYLYEHFCSASVYYFTRTKKRKTWFVKESLKLYWNVLEYAFFLILPVVVMLFLRGDLQAPTGTDVFFLFYYLVIYSLFLFLAAELINIIAICTGSGAGFACVEFICLGGICSYLILGEIFFEEEYILTHPELIRYNPIAHIFLDIHSSRIPAVEADIGRLEHVFFLGDSLLLYVILALVLVVIGSLIVSKKEIYYAKPEGGN